jgi:type IV pilus assembly protein PilQ
MIFSRFKVVLLSFLVVASWPAGEAWGKGRITAVGVKVAGETTRVTITGTDSLTCNHFYLDSPPRIVLDLPDTWNGLPRKRFLNLDRGGVISIRSSQYRDNLSRVVIDLARKVSYSVLPGKDLLEVTFPNPDGSFGPWESGEVVQGGGNGGMGGPGEAGGVPANRKEAKRITVDFQSADIRAVIRAFSEFSGASIVAGKDVEGKVTGKITDLPWDQAFRVLMRANGYGVDVQDGIYRVDKMEVLRSEETLEVLKPTVFRLNYINPDDIASTVKTMLSERGQVQTDVKTNSLIVTDVPDKVEAVKRIISQLDIKTKQVTIKSELLFVNSVDLTQLGIEWQATNTMDPTTDTHGSVESGQSVTDPFLQMTFGTLKNGTNITGILQALQERQLIDVQAQPQITTMDNLEAQVFVGEKTPIRVLDVGAQTSAAASIQLVETGIRLTVTPHITNDRKIIMDLKAERSNAVLVPTEVGVEFQTQEGKTTLLVDDGQTAVIGGLTTVNKTKIRRGIPLLSKMPILGFLFRYSSDNVEKKDLLIFVTPYITS